MFLAHKVYFSVPSSGVIQTSHKKSPKGRLKDDECREEPRISAKSIMTEKCNDVNEINACGKAPVTIGPRNTNRRQDLQMRVTYDSGDPGPNG